MYRIGDLEIEELTRVIRSRKLFRLGDPAQGHQQEVARFEREWAELVGTKYALCVSGGGTAALICALVGLEIGPGDEVLVPGYTFMATAAAVLAVGAIPVIVDVDESLTLDAGDLERKITTATRAVIPVHMLGLPANLEAIRAAAKRAGLLVLEDCCQADGGSYRGRRLGSWGDAGAFSFNDFKIMSCGEGGAVVTSDRRVYERALIQHDSGITFRSFSGELAEPIFIGHQYRATELMGAVLRMQLGRLEGILADLRRMKRELVGALTGERGVRFAPVNDEAGDCGVVAVFQFDTEAAARSFAKSPGVGGVVPFDTGKHVYTNWDPILQQRVGGHRDLNPFHHPRNRDLRLDCGAGDCPRTTEILRRSVYIQLNPDWSAEELAAKIAACRQAAAGAAG